VNIVVVVVVVVVVVSVCLSLPSIIAVYYKFEQLYMPFSSSEVDQCFFFSNVSIVFPLFLSQH
jgi:hypothetical protein